MSTPPGRLRVPATLDAVARATQVLEQQLPPQLAEHDRYGIVVAVAEVLTNIVRHGYGGQRGPDIELAWRADARSLVVEVHDRGRPVPADRLDQAGPETFAFDPSDVDALPEHGLGLGIVKTAFDHVDYRTRDGVNRMRMGKRL